MLVFLIALSSLARSQKLFGGGAIKSLSLGNIYCMSTYLQAANVHAPRRVNLGMGNFANRDLTNIVLKGLDLPHDVVLD